MKRPIPPGCTMMERPTLPMPSQQSAPLWLLTLISLLATAWLWPGALIDLGLHGDEAYVGLAAHRLLHGGPLKFVGMNTHTGPLHQWLVACAFGLNGPSITSLRAVSALCNGLATALLARVLWPRLGPARALWAALLMLTLPAFSTFGAVATEHMGLSAVLALGACNILAQQPLCGRRARPFIAGVLLGLGTWTHLVFLAVPAAWAAVAWHAYGRRILAHCEVRWALYGWMLVEAAPFARLSVRIKVRHGGAGIVARLGQVPTLLLESWRGELAALRTVGASSEQSVWPWLLLAAIACAGIVMYARTSPGARAPLTSCAWALGAMLFTTALIVPFSSDRFIWLVLLALPVLLVLGFFAFPKPWPHVLCLLLATLQIHTFVRHIVQPLGEHRAQGNSFDVFSVPETSNHYLDTRPVLTALAAQQLGDVVCQNFIGWALRFHLVTLPTAPPLRVRLSDDDDSFEARAALEPNDTLVIYARGHRNDHLEDVRGWHEHTRLQHFLLLRKDSGQPLPPKS